LSYIRSHVGGSIEYSGTRCGDYYLIPQRLTALIGRKILDSAVDEVLKAWSIHVAPRAIQIVVVPAGVTIQLGLHNPPCSWTGMVGPSLPGFTIAPCVDSLLCYRIVQVGQVYPSRLSKSPRYMYACIHLHLSCHAHLYVRLYFFFLKLSHGIDKILVYLCPYGFNNRRNPLM
jgi:hypothetical protein